MSFAIADGSRRVEAIWLAQSFFDDFILVYPVYAILMLERGASEFELSILFVIWSASAVLFEIPSGVLADRLDRRRYVFTGSLIRALGFLTWWLWPVLPGFAVGFVLWSLGSAIHSGTLQALLHDLLAEQRRGDAFARIYGRGKAAQSLGVLLAMAIGGFVAETGYTLVLLLSAAAPIVAGGLVLGLLEEPPRTFVKTTDDGTRERPLALALRALLSNGRLRLIAMMFVLFMGLSGVMDEYLGPLLAEPGTLSLGVIGVLYGVILGSRALGTLAAHRLRRLSLSRIGLISAAAHAVLLVGLLAGVSASNPTLVLALCAYFALQGVVEVLLETHQQAAIDVSARATVTSVAGAGLEVWAVVLFVSIGVLAENAGWTAALGTVAVVAVLLSAFLALLARR
ncbi:MAG: MFS transporter [Pseudomonadota bacterium]